MHIILDIAFVFPYFTLLEIGKYQLISLILFSQTILRELRVSADAFDLELHFTNIIIKE